MKNIVIALLVLAPVVLLARMGYEDEDMGQFVGQHKSVLIQSWGPPDRVTTDGKGGQVFVYIEETGSIRQTEAECDSYYNQDLQYIENCRPGRIIDDRSKNIRMFYVNAKGYVYYYRWEYNK